MDITPPRLPLDSLLKRRPMRVFDVSCPPAEAVARCVAFWRTIGIKRESTTMCKRFAGIGWSGTEVTVMPGQVENRKRSRTRDHDTLLDVAEISPTLALGGLAIQLSAKGRSRAAAPPQQDAHHYRGAPLARRRTGIH